MSEQRVDAYARAILGIASVEQLSGEVEDELFRFARTFEGNDALRNALVDATLPVERRLAVIEELIGGRALTVTLGILEAIVTIGRAADLPAIVDRYVALAAETRSHEVAEVRSAVALDESQMKRLADALGRATGKQVEVKVIIDPSVMGGLVATVGDTVIDGTIRHRLNQLEESI